MASLVTHLSVVRRALGEPSSFTPWTTQPCGSTIKGHVLGVYMESSTQLVACSAVTCLSISLWCKKAPAQFAGRTELRL